MVRPNPLHLSEYPFFPDGAVTSVTGGSNNPADARPKRTTTKPAAIRLDFFVSMGSLLKTFL
jgi:hypothetical protein